MDIHIYLRRGYIIIILIILLSYLLSCDTSSNVNIQDLTINIKESKSVPKVEVHVADDILTRILFLDALSHSTFPAKDEKIDFRYCHRSCS